METLLEMARWEADAIRSKKNVPRIILRIHKPPKKLHSMGELIS